MPDAFIIDACRTPRGIGDWRQPLLPTPDNYFCRPERDDYASFEALSAQSTDVRFSPK